MENNEKITISRLRETLDIKPGGILIWKVRPGKTSWNTRFAGKRAFTAKNRKGYSIGTIDGRGILAHRAVWALINGRWPSAQIDHIDGNPQNNSPENLRDVLPAENQRNMSLFVTNTSGICGVFKKDGKWAASIKVDGKSIHLGTYTDKAQAAAARWGAERALGFHPSHGRPKCSTNLKDAESG